MNIDFRNFLIIPSHLFYLSLIRDWSAFHAYVTLEERIDQFLFRKSFSQLEAMRTSISREMQLHPEDPLATRKFLLIIHAYLEHKQFGEKT